MAAEYPPPESIPPYGAGNPPPPAYPSTGANPPPLADVEEGGGAAKPPAGGEPDSGGSSRMCTSIGIGLRVAELTFCVTSFSLLVSTEGDYTEQNAGAFMLAMTIIGFILSFTFLVLLVASLFVSTLRRFQGKLRLFQFAECWLLSLLLFAAACSAGAQAWLCSPTWYSGTTFFGNHYFPSRKDCDQLNKSVVAAFLASFAYIGGFWYYVFLSHYSR